MGGAPDAKTIHSNQKETVQVVLWNKTCDVQIIEQKDRVLSYTENA